MPENFGNDFLDASILESNLSKIAYTLDRGYLSHLDDYGVFKFEEYCKLRGIEYKAFPNFMGIKINNFIINKNEKVIDCMKNILGAFSNSLDTLSFLIHRKVDVVDVYFIFKKDGIVDATECSKRLNLLNESFKGNFPGSETRILKDEKKLDIENGEFKFLNESKYISMLTSVPSEKSEDYICQGIEKLLNGVVPKNENEEYAVLVLAESITQEGIREVISGFEEMATSISPYAAHQFQKGKNDSESNGEMNSTTDTNGTSHAISKTHSINIGASVGNSFGRSSGSNSSIADIVSNTEGDSVSDTVTDSTNESNTDSSSETLNESETNTTGESIAESINGGVNESFNTGVQGGIPGVIGGNVGYSVGEFVSTGSTTGTNTAKAIGKSIGKTTGKAVTKGVAQSIGKTIAKNTAKTIGKTVTSGVFSSISKVLSIGLQGGYGYSWGKIDTDSESKSLTDGTNHTVTLGTSESSTYNYKSYHVNDLLQNLEATIKRLTESKSTGLWKTSTYIFEKNSNGNVARNVSNYLMGLSQGDESYIEVAFIHEWSYSEKANNPFNEIKKYLLKFIHPIFINKNDMNFNFINKNIWSSLYEYLNEKGSIEYKNYLESIKSSITEFVGDEIDGLDDFVEKTLENIKEINDDSSQIIKEINDNFNQIIKENNLSSEQQKKLEICVNNLIDGLKVGNTDLIPITPTINISTIEGFDDFIEKALENIKEFNDDSSQIIKEINDDFNQIIKENNLSSEQQKKLEICVNNLIDGLKVSNTDLIPITPTTNISTTELAKIFSLPTHSLPGLPILECAEFGRNVASYDDIDYNNLRSFKLGNIYHMHHEEKQVVKLASKSLASHTFVTGSTGSGKSNTVYQLLSEAMNYNKKFLVVEPAKGEYKNVFGMDDNVNVYGTNPQKMPLLCINPFSFPKEIHILEHLDRLIEIFNVCWPMYAAMPAVLKEAIEKSYEDAGWDLTESTNEYGENLYPTFADVTRNIRTIIDSSEYDAENKGAYKGSLITRLKSLTNGINGLIFTTDELTEQELFDENVIIDLSRVGSSETKSLIMGLLVLKLQEYRMTEGFMNSELRHVTVLEEAHNLLRRTSENSSDSGNLRSKSVEMLTNAIAEMRTYGEGFIIADQAPGLLDMAVIRNTNTKIIMRLPDLGDRELVGKAANLSDSQIEELAKLPCGVAAVYQNEWVQPVLCKVEQFIPDDDSMYEMSINKNIESVATMKKRFEIARMLCATPNEPNVLKDLKDLNFSGCIYVSAKKYIESSRRKPSYNQLARLISDMFPEFIKILHDSSREHPTDIKIWRTELQDHIENSIKEFLGAEDTALRNSILQCILMHYVANVMQKPKLLDTLNPR